MAFTYDEDDYNKDKIVAGDPVEPKRRSSSSSGGTGQGGSTGEGIPWKDKKPHQKANTVAGVAGSLQTLADLGKKAFGTSDEMRAAYSAQIANTDPVKKGGPREKSLSTRVNWKDDTSSTSTKKVTENTNPIFTADDEEYRKNADKIKKRYG
tara:strand:+ start:303 stop:758 length:456 start_codon:yes stop_codon:yes gene_type:complete